MATVSIASETLLLQADASTALMFAARAGSMGAFTVLFLYTPEVKRHTRCKYVWWRSRHVTQHRVSQRRVENKSWKK